MTPCPKGHADLSRCPSMDKIKERREPAESGHGFMALLECSECGRTCEAYVASPALE